MVDYATSTLLTPTVIAKEALRLLKNNLVMGNLVHRAYESEFPGTPKVGGTVTIRKPVKFKATKARTRATSTIEEGSITLTVSTQAHVSWGFIMSDLTLSIEEYSERYLRPAAATLANTIDADLCALYDDLYQSVWESTGIVNPSTFMVLGKAMQKLDESACPPEDRVVVFNPAGHWSMANALAALSIPSIPEKAIRKGFLGQIANCDVYMDQNIKAHTTGNFDSSGTGLDGTGINVASDPPTTGSVPVTAIKLNEFKAATDATSVLKVGDVFTIAGVYAVNPMSGESTGALKQFTVTAAVTNGSVGSDTAGPVTVHVDPAMYDTGAYKTVDTLPAKDAAVDIVGGAKCQIPQNLAFHKNCFALVMVPLDKPDSTWGTTLTEEGYSIRVVKWYDGDEDLELVRLDVLYGVKTIYPELGVRVLGASVGT